MSRYERVPDRGATGGGPAPGGGEHELQLLTAEIEKPLEATACCSSAPTSLDRGRAAVKEAKDLLVKGRTVIRAEHG